MLDEMSSTEFLRWEQFYLLEPWGSEADDQHFGTVGALIGNFAGKVRDKAAQPLTWREIFPSRIPDPNAPKVSLANRIRGWFGIKKKE